MCPTKSEIDSVFNLLGIDEDSIYKVKSNDLLPNELKKEIIKWWNARKRIKGESDTESEMKITMNFVGHAKSLWVNYAVVSRDNILYLCLILGFIDS